MHNSVWKLTSLATVAGVALFFIVQAQKLINPQGKNSQANVIGDESFPEDSDRQNSDREHSREGLSDNDTPNGPNALIEPDPFADEDSSERKITSAKYGNAREEALHGTDDADHSANRRGLQTRTASRRQPHLRLPKGETENPFQESDESIAEEAVKVGPRLSLPGKARPVRIDDDSSAGVESEESTSNIRRTSAAEIPSLEESPGPSFSGSEEDDGDFRSGRSREKPALDPNDDPSGPALIGQDDSSPARTDNTATIDDKFSGFEKSEASSPPSLNGDPANNGDSSESGRDENDDSAVFSRDSRRDQTPVKPREELEYAADPKELSTSEDRSGGGRVDPEFPEADNPMPEAVTPGEEPQLFRNGGRDRVAPGDSIDDDAELFPNADSAERPNARALPSDENSPDRSEESPSVTHGKSAVSSEMPEAGKPYLSIEKKSPPSAVLGQKMVYEILVSNPGTVPARQVVLNDDVPEGVDLDGTVPRAELSGRRLVWRLGTLNPGDRKLIKVRVTPVRVGEVGSVATVNFLSEKESAKTVPTNFQLEHRRPLARVPQLEVTTSELPAAIGLNRKFRVVLTIKNSDRITLRQVLMSAELDDHVRHQEVSDKRIENLIGDLQPGESATVDLDLEGAAAGMSINRLTLWVGDEPVRESEMNFRILPLQ